jgi:hypothetical protein
MNPIPDWLVPPQVDGDDPRNWKTCNRPLSPAELMYAFAIHECSDYEPLPPDGQGSWFGVYLR